MQQLALRARGAAARSPATTCSATTQEVANVLGLPDDATQIALLPVAYTTTTDFRPAARPPVEEITSYDGGLDRVNP